MSNLQNLQTTNKTTKTTETTITPTESIAKYTTNIKSLDVSHLSSDAYKALNGMLILSIADILNAGVQRQMQRHQFPSCSIIHIYSPVSITLDTTYRFSSCGQVQRAL